MDLPAIDQERRFRIIATLSVLLVFISAVYVTKEFIPVVFFSIFLAYLLRPLYSFLLRLTGRRHLSSLLSIIITLIAFISIVLSLVVVLSGEVSDLFGSADEIVMHSNLTGNITTSEHILSGEGESLLDRYINRYIDMLGGSTGSALNWILHNYLGQLRSLALSMIYWVLENLSSAVKELISELPLRFAQFLLAIFFTYYILIDGKEIMNKAVDLLPKRNVVDMFLKELNSIFNTLFGVYFATSMLSGVLAAIGFFILQIPYPLIWGGLIAILTLIPMVGPTAVFIPMALYFIIVHNYFTASALLIFGTIFLMIIPENVIRPSLAQKSASIHPIITMLAYTAPIFVLGLMGMIIGPMLYGFLLAAYRIGARLKAEKEKET